MRIYCTLKVVVSMFLFRMKYGSFGKMNSCFFSGLFSFEQLSWISSLSFVQLFILFIFLFCSVFFSLCLSLPLEGALSDAFPSRPFRHSLSWSGIANKITVHVAECDKFNDRNLLPMRRLISFSRVFIVSLLSAPLIPLFSSNMTYGQCVEIHTIPCQTLRKQEQLFSVELWSNEHIFGIFTKCAHAKCDSVCTTRIHTYAADEISALIVVDSLDERVSDFRKWIYDHILQRSLNRCVNYMVTPFPHQILIIIRFWASQIKLSVPVEMLHRPEKGNKSSYYSYLYERDSSIELHLNSVDSWNPENMKRIFWLNSLYECPRHNQHVRASAHVNLYQSIFQWNFNKSLIQ